MYALAASTIFESCRDYPEGFSAALDFALTADEIFDQYNNAPCGYHSLDARGLFLRINNTELKWLGYTRDEVVGRMRFADILAPESEEIYRKSVTTLAKRGVLRDVEFRLRRKDGTLLDVSLECTALYSDSGEYLSARSRVSDISDRKRSESGLRDQERFINRVLRATPDIVYVVDVETRRNIFANRETAAQLGYTSDEISAMGDTLFERLVHPEDVPKVAAHIIRILSANDDAILETEYRLRRSDGIYRIFASRDTVFARNSSGAVTQYLGICQDVTEQRIAHRAIEEQTARLQDFAARLASQRDELEQANRHLQTLASTDGLTGLPNHRAFQERLRIAFEHASRDKTPLSLLLLDIDYFKQYNDSFGHPAGDEVLRAVGSVLESAARQGDSCARYGGEEFAMIVPHMGPEDALQFAEQIRRAVEAIPDTYRAITTCVGVASFHPEMTAPSSLISDADAAMYQAKRNGRNQVRHVNGYGI
ncbi:MAG: diguanylate cyclase [Fibrella sp.]|nr:diguanylate cyclase [Armatimonadota bacterium]